MACELLAGCRLLMLFGLVLTLLCQFPYPSCPGILQHLPCEEAGIPAFTGENGRGWDGDDKDGGRAAGEESADPRSSVLAIAEQGQEGLRVERSFSSGEMSR